MFDELPWRLTLAMAMILNWMHWAVSRHVLAQHGVDYFQLCWVNLFYIILAGDLGGYMGLLVGGSVITVFEILDLFCYNSLAKLYGYFKKKKQQKDPGSSPQDSETALSIREVTTEL